VRFILFTCLNTVLLCVIKTLSEILQHKICFFADYTAVIIASSVVGAVAIIAAICVFQLVR